MSKKLSPEKWVGYKNQYSEWWNNLSNDEKLKAKEHFLKIRDWNLHQRNPYPNMWDIKDIRISKLSEKQIYRIWVFKDKSI